MTLDGLWSLWSAGLVPSRHSLEEARIRSWFDLSDTKDRMRLACDLGLATGPCEAHRFVFDVDPDGILLADRLVADVSRLSDASWASLSYASGSAIGSFLPVEIRDDDEAFLVHFTHDPGLVLVEGFLGTSDHEKLSSTFGLPKTSTGFNFAFRAGSFEVDNYGDDGFYGLDAVVFRARHLATFNVESGDEEILFEGATVDALDLIHMRNDDGIWSVLSVDGEIVVSDRSLNACLRWLDARELDVGARLRGGRSYEMRILGEYGDPEDCEGDRPRSALG